MPSFEEISPRPLDPRLLQLSGISRASVEAHYRLYQGYVGKRNEILAALEGVDLEKANQVYSELRAKGETAFLGYDELQADGEVIGIIADGAQVQRTSSSMR